MVDASVFPTNPSIYSRSTQRAGMSSFYVRAGGLFFLFLGALWAGLGLYVSELLVVGLGGAIAVAGTVLLGLAPRIAERAAKTP